MGNTSGNREDSTKNNRPFSICLGILAHVDAGKTTLSEAMLYQCGAIRKLGRVDNQDAFLDTYELERSRGITIFSKQARLRLGETQVTLLDTPGHVDFSSEMERTLQVMGLRSAGDQRGGRGAGTHQDSVETVKALQGAGVFVCQQDGSAGDGPGAADGGTAPSAGRRMRGF